MSVTWRKVWRDLTLTEQSAHSVAVLSIAVGVFALGVIYGTYDIILLPPGGKPASDRPRPHDLLEYLFDYTAAEAVLHEPGVADVEKQVDSYILWKLEGDKYRHTANLIARVDYEKQRMGLVNLVAAVGLRSGRWPSNAKRRGISTFPLAQPSSYNLDCTSRNCRCRHCVCL